MTFTSLLSGASFVVAIAAWAKARRASKRLERLTEAYWELRYEHGQLRARFNQLSPEQFGAGAESSSHDRVSAFIPLSSLKR